MLGMGIFSMVSMVVAVCVLILGFGLRSRIGDKGNLLGVCFSVVFLLLAITLALNDTTDETHVTNNLAVSQVKLTALEDYLTSDEHMQLREQKFSICLLGDSTHVSRGDKRMRMLNVLQRFSVRDGIPDVEWYGLSQAGMDVYEFYFLFQRIMLDQPDLVVIPVNLRSFGENWLDPDVLIYRTFERNCFYREMPSALMLSSFARPIRLHTLLLQKLDYRWLNYRGHLLFDAAKGRYDTAETKLMEDVALWLEPYALPFPENFDADDPVANLKRFAEFHRVNYNPQIGFDHPYLPVFRAINRLARKKDIKIMYYTVQTPVEPANQERNFAFLSAQFGQDPGVEFVHMTDLLAPEHFEIGEHFYRNGMRLVATRLVREVASLKAEIEASAQESRRGDE